MLNNNRILTRALFTLDNPAVLASCGFTIPAGIYQAKQCEDLLVIRNLQGNLVVSLPLTDSKDVVTLMYSSPVLSEF